MNSQPNASAYVFVSYSSRDQKQVDRVVRRIEAHGIPCWVSSRDIGPGRDFQQEIVASLQAAAVVLLIFSAHANNSVEIPRELILATKYRKLMIPARIEKVEPTGAFIYPLSNAQFIDLFGDFDKKIQILCDSITQHMSAALGPARPVAVVRSNANLKYWPAALAAAALVIAAGSAWAIFRHGNLPAQAHGSEPMSSQVAPVAPAEMVTTPPTVARATLTTRPAPILVPKAATDAMSVKARPVKAGPVKAGPAVKPVSAVARAPVVHAEKAPLPRLSAVAANIGATVIGRFPDAKIISWFPNVPNAAPPPDLLGSADARWTVVDSKTGQMRLVIQLSTQMVALDHVVLRLKSRSGTALLPTTAVISLSNSRHTGLDSFRYVSTCVLTSPGVTRCDIGSQDARAISVELFRETKPIRATAFSIGF